MPTKIQTHRQIWKTKKIIREIYTGWYRKILEDLAPTPKKTLEMGAGSGNFKEFKPGVISSDIEPNRWLDIAFDAHHMPFKSGSAGNIVMVDVLHHLADPLRFFQEASRVLESGGRIVILEPYPTPFSLFIYRRYHPEPFIMDADYFNRETTGNSSTEPAETDKKDPWDSNQAMAYRLFFKDREKFEALFQREFRIRRKHLLSCILYPASGGFENKAMIPDYLIPVFKIMEYLMIPLRRLLAFRCYIVLEKKCSKEKKIEEQR
jgi:SAM-dependent methyltransferase